MDTKLVEDNICSFVAVQYSLVISLVHVLWWTQTRWGRAVRSPHHSPPPNYCQSNAVHASPVVFLHQMFSSWDLILWGAVFVSLQPVKIDDHSSMTIVYLLHSVRNMTISCPQRMDKTMVCRAFSISLGALVETVPRHDLPLWMGSHVSSYYRAPSGIQAVVLFSPLLWHMLLLECLGILFGCTIH